MSETVAVANTANAFVPCIALRGNRRAIGLQHGEELRENIAKTIQIYRGLLCVTGDRAREVAAHFESVIRAKAAQIAAEIDGIAEGAGVDPYLIYLINARSEVMSQSAPECTAAFSPKNGYLAQNWDWVAAMEDLIVVLDIEHEDGLRLLTVTEPGIVGKIGLNSLGVGVCLNFMYVDQKLSGLPIHILLRQLLEARDRGELDACIENAELGRAGNILIGTDRFGGLDLEYLGDKVRRHDINSENFVHANHPLGDETSLDENLPNSIARLAKAEEKGAAAAEMGWRHMNDLLSDQSNEEYPVCRPYVDLFGQPGGTVCSIIMDLNEKTMHVRKGPNPNAPYQTYGAT
jgi:isopenicillin-N N-acyltransferase-like protein